MKKPKIEIKGCFWHEDGIPCQCPYSLITYGVQHTCRKAIRKLRKDKRMPKWCPLLTEAR